MRSLSILLTLLPTLVLTNRSKKRGLIFIPHEEHPEDSAVWVQTGSDLTWYYNYGIMPSSAFAGISQTKLEFVPMMWGIKKGNPSDTTFLDTVRRMMTEQELNITHALSYNEPDMKGGGGSGVSPKDGAQGWVKNMMPLQELGVKVGLPACTGGPGGLPWLQQFLGNCSEMISSGGDKKNCSFDFVPVHWYDNFEGLQSHVSSRVAAFPDSKIWVTEYAYAHRDLQPTQDFYNRSAQYFDTLPAIERYSYFGAFRSKDSNVGKHATFLNNDGALTDIGSWYLGGSATGVEPASGSGAPGSLRAPLLAAITIAALSYVLLVL